MKPRKKRFEVRRSTGAPSKVNGWRPANMNAIAEVEEFLKRESNHKWFCSIHNGGNSVCDCRLKNELKRLQWNDKMKPNDKK